MDFNIDDELDYEEDDLQNDSESKNDAEDEKNANSNMSGSDDQYIQMNYSEEDENFFERIALDSESAKTQNNEKTDEESEKAKLEKPLSGEEQCTQENKSNENNNININNSNNSIINTNNSNYCNSNNNSNIDSKKSNKKLEKKKRPFRYCLKMKKPPANTLSISSSSNWNFLSAYNVVKPLKKSVFDEQILNLSQGFYSSSQFPLLGLYAAQPEQNLPQLMAVGDSHMAVPPINKDRSNFRFEKEKTVISRRLRHENVRTNIITRNENSKSNLSAQNFNTRVQGFADNYQICEAKKNFKHWAFLDRNDNDAEPHVKNYNGKNENRFFNGRNNFLKDDEKELVRLKKEARLKRFMNDGIVRKEKKLIDSGENEIKDGLNLGAEYFQKLEKQKLTREKLLSLKGQKRENSNCDTDKDASAEKPDINKELLLRKRNPFDANSGKSNCSSMNTIKQEKERPEELKQESFAGELFIPISQQFRKKEEGKVLTALDSFPQGLSVVKSETAPPVKFVRTISKSFDELALRFKIKVFSSKEDESSSPSAVTTLPFVAANKISYTNLPTQAESQLTGCIVKVCNIPPSTTVNDILALCSSIGIVKEIKLNLPKENSVVIRFGEPSCAENFFSVYHGQKMNNFFLNVIVI